jgi:hypothetical protein
MPKAKAPKNPKSSVNKSAWIRQHPGVAANELVALADKEGIKLNAGLVYAIRSADKHKSGSATVKVSKTAAVSGLSGLDGAIRAMVKQAVREELKAIFSKL